MGTLVPRRALTAAALAVAALAVTAGSAPAQTATPRVVGGANVPISQFPFQVRLDIAGTFLCGGAIVDATHVVTAAHCVTNTLGAARHASQVEVYYGSARLSTQSHADASAVAVPVQYTLGDDSFDAAVVTLSAALTFSANTRPIAFANPAQPRAVGNAVVSGFGQISGSSGVSPTLRAATVPLRSAGTCAAFYGGDYVSARSVCAGGGGAPANNPDTCNGDSGGPLAVDLDNRPSATSYVLLGLTSYGPPDGSCGGPGKPAVYTYVQGATLRNFLSADSRQTAGYTGGNFEGGTSVGLPSPPPLSPPPPDPSPAAQASTDTTRPTARVTKVKCKRRRCKIRIRTYDRGGGSVQKLGVKVSRRVRSCRLVEGSRRCKTRRRTKKLHPRRIRGGYSITVRLRPGRYSLAAVAKDTSGNRSRTARKRFRVRGSTPRPV